MWYGKNVIGYNIFGLLEPIITAQIQYRTLVGYHRQVTIKSRLSIRRDQGNFRTARLLCGGSISVNVVVVVVVVIRGNYDIPITNFTT